MVCTIARSGSSYFCELLASTGQLGTALEYFNTAGQRKYIDPNYPAKRKRQLKWIRTRGGGATLNGIYGVKVLAQQIAAVGNTIDIFRDLPGLRYVRLNRRDMIGQAVSRMRAGQTRSFWSTHPEQATAHYDRDRIRRCLEDLLEYHAIWDRTLADLGVEVLTLDYEDVLRDPQAAVDRVAEMMGLPLPVPIDTARLTLKIMRDDNNAEWRTRFLAETGNEYRHLAGDD